MARAVEIVLAAGWAVFWVYWIVAAFSMKRGRLAWGPEILVRVILVAIVIVLVRLHAFGGGVHVDAPRAAVGLVAFALGLALAFWARRDLGRNWGTPMTQKVDAELVTSGPYRFVRHPIYSGILFALLGTAVVFGFRWLIVAGLAALYFVYSAVVEERHLTRQFPEAYPAYRRSTKMLVPFIL